MIDIRYGMRVQCGERTELSIRFLAAAVDAGIPLDLTLRPRTVRCVIEHQHADEEHQAVLAELPLADTAEVWVSWLSGHEPHTVERRTYCPVSAGPDRPCELYAQHPDGHSWQLIERHVTA
ncbi:hypothetical protein ABZY68_25540 [Streptomyces sp. NPDC006482]|uniref:hypothetical protein n=1 Tax=Streptomyces sp. NPDC006482 TaxID=3154306 RepID=UPI0033BF0234